MVVLERVREWSRSTRTAMETLGNFLERLGGSFCNVYLYARKVVRETAAAGMSPTISTKSPRQPLMVSVVLSVQLPPRCSRRQAAVTTDKRPFGLEKSRIAP